MNWRAEANTTIVAICTSMTGTAARSCQSSMEPLTKKSSTERWKRSWRYPQIGVVMNPRGYTAPKTVSHSRPEALASGVHVPMQPSPTPQRVAQPHAQHDSWSPTAER